MSVAVINHRGMKSLWHSMKTLSASSLPRITSWFKVNLSLVVRGPSPSLRCLDEGKRLAPYLCPSFALNNERVYDHGSRTLSQGELLTVAIIVRGRTFLGETYRCSTGHNYINFASAEPRRCVAIITQRRVLNCSSAEFRCNCKNSSFARAEHYLAVSL